MFKNKAYAIEYQNKRRSFEAVFVPENSEKDGRFEIEGGLLCQACDLFRQGGRIESACELNDLEDITFRMKIK